MSRPWVGDKFDDIDGGSDESVGAAGGVRSSNKATVMMRSNVWNAELVRQFAKLTRDEGLAWPDECDWAGDMPVVEANRLRRVVDSNEAGGDGAPGDRWN